MVTRLVIISHFKLDDKIVSKIHNETIKKITLIIKLIVPKIKFKKSSGFL